LRRVVAHILERQDCNRRLVRQREPLRRFFRRGWFGLARSVPIPNAPGVRTRGAGSLSDTRQPVSTESPQGAVERNIVFTVDSATSTVIRKLRVSPNGKLLALGDEEGLIRIVSLDTFEVAATFQAHSGRVSDLDFTRQPNSALCWPRWRHSFLGLGKSPKKCASDKRAESSTVNSVQCQNKPRFSGPVRYYGRPGRTARGLGY
jgi:hypothetical protein